MNQTNDIEKFGVQWVCIKCSDGGEFFFSGELHTERWCIEQHENVWKLWDGLKLVYEDLFRVMVFMKASELIFEEASKQFIPIWNQ